MPSSTGLEHRYLKHETPTPPPLQVCFKKKKSLRLILTFSPLNNSNLHII